MGAVKWNGLAELLRVSGAGRGAESLNRHGECWNGLGERKQGTYREASVLPED